MWLIFCDDLSHDHFCHRASIFPISQTSRPSIFIFPVLSDDKSPVRIWWWCGMSCVHKMLMTFPDISSSWAACINPTHTLKTTCSIRFMGNKMGLHDTNVSWTYMIMNMHVNKEASSLKILNNVSNTLLIMTGKTHLEDRVPATHAFWSNPDDVCVCLCVRVHQCGRFNLCTLCDFHTQQWCIILHFFSYSSQKWHSRR